MNDFQVTLEKAAFSGRLVEIKTKGRGIIAGKYIGTDEFDTDEERFGFFIDSVSDGLGYSVYIDEIVDVRIVTESDTALKEAV